MNESEIFGKLDAYRKLGARTGSIGISAFGRDIPFAAFGNAGRALLVTAGIHAREYPTADAAFAMTEYARRNLDLRAYGLIVVPMLNPDGAALCREGIVSAPVARREYLLNVNAGDDFRLWKANARGVDLNVNFPARWSTGKSNLFSPASENYVGARPASEPETRAIMRFTHATHPAATLSLHAKGREIYWEFGQCGLTRDRDRAFAETAARSTGYAKIDGTLGSAGGYKDWCVETLGVPALTVEIGRDEANHPLSDAEIKTELPRLECLAADLIRFLEEE